MKMDKKAKIKMVKEHIEEFVTLKELEEKYGVGIDHIKYMIALYRKHGEKSFSDEIRKYTRETKLAAIKRVYQLMNQLKNLENSRFNIIVNKLMQLYGVWDISDFLN